MLRSEHVFLSIGVFYIMHIVSVFKRMFKVPKLTLKTMSFFTTVVLPAAMVMDASLNSMPIEKPNVFVILSTKSGLSVLTLLTTEL